MAGGTSIVVQVQLRRGDALYVNDGVWQSFGRRCSRLSFPGPAGCGRRPAPHATREIGYRLFGPTRDSVDVLKGPFVLPDAVAEGDGIEIGQLGAYGACLRTAFNGFDRAGLVEVCDRPMLQEPHEAGSTLAA